MLKKPRTERYRTVSVAKAGGVTYTPKVLADFVARKLLRFAEPLRPSQPVHVLDPAVGRGELLVSLLGALPNDPDVPVEVTGFDTDARQLNDASSRLKRRFPCTRIQLLPDDFLDFFLRRSGSTEQRDVFHEERSSAFDLIIANPPYVRTQIMGARRARSLANRFRLNGRVDMYHAFVLALLKMLRPGGSAGIILSNRFMTTRAGAGVRESILSNFTVRRIWDLGDTKLFNAAVLPAVVIVKQSMDGDRTPPPFTSIYETSEPAMHRARDPIAALARNGVAKVGDGRRFRVRHGTLDTGGSLNGIWRITTNAVDRWLATVDKNKWATFGQIGQIRVGVKTCADRVFTRGDWHDMPARERPELLRPLMTHRSARQFRSVATDTPIQILYPHEVRDGRRRTVDITEYPRSKAYLDTHRAQLENRRYVIDAGRQWYEIWVPQNPGAWKHPKLVFRDITAEPTFWLDFDGHVINGDCYWLACGEPNRIDLLWLAVAVGNSEFIKRFYDLRFHNKLYAGRRRFITQYVQYFPVPDPASALGQDIIQMAQYIYEHIESDDVQQLKRELDDKIWKSFGLVAEEALGLAGSATPQRSFARIPQNPHPT